MEDSKIIELFFERSDRAVECVSEKYGRGLLSLSYNILQNRQDAEECVNDTYVVLWNTIPPERPDPLFAYTCKITRNISLARRKYNTAQKRNAAGNVSLEEIGDVISDECEQVAGLERNELASILGSWLDTLDERNFYVFMHRYWFMDSVSAIAVELGVSEQAVYLRLERLKKKLKVYLKARGVLI